MKTNIDETILNQIERRIEAVRSIKDKTLVREGWIKYMRNALGLTQTKLASLVNLNSANIMQAEKRESEGNVSIATLKKMAQAMECEFVYAFVPKKKITEIIHDKAYDKAKKSLINADLHMKLENQGVEGEMDEKVERLAKKLIQKGDIW